MVKAVVVGINAYPTSPLRGCVNDALDVIDYLIASKGYAHSDIFPLFDERATKEAIEQALRDMIANSSPGDHLLFHISCHGAQMASQDLNEPDGLDEVLCPIDFDWSPVTALSDNLLSEIFSTVPPSVALTAVVDACHSGDLSRDFATALTTVNPRFMPMPQDIALRLKGRLRIVHPRSLTRSNIAVVSACGSAQEAADTSFDSRPNGAFTYFWLAQLKAQPLLTLEDNTKALVTPLKKYSMTPEVDARSAIRTATFLGTVAMSNDLSAPTRALTSGRSFGNVIFNQSWTADVLGLGVGVNLLITNSGSGFDFQLTATPETTLIFRINGDTTEQIDMIMGFKLILQVRGWRLSSTSLEFDLALLLGPPSILGFSALPATLVSKHVTMPIEPLTRSLVAPASAAELMAQLQLAQLQNMPRMPFDRPRDAPPWLPLGAVVELKGGMSIQVGTRAWWFLTYLDFENIGTVPTTVMVERGESEQLEPGQTRTIKGAWAAVVITVINTSSSVGSLVRMTVR